MSAKEMFEKQGYICCKKYENGDLNYYTPCENHYVYFDVHMKYCDIGDSNIDVRLHKAIHQQMKELGWLDDRDTPKKGVWQYYNNFGDMGLCCPNCKALIRKVFSTYEYKPNYCDNCGQALEWSDENE